MSSYFGVAISTEHILAIHKESKGIIFMISAPGISFDEKIIENLRRSIDFEEIELPTKDGEISQSSIMGKYVVIRAGKLVYSVVIINQKPNRFTREALHAFGIRFESRWGREIKNLYTEFDGNIKIFLENTERKGNVGVIVEEVFHLSLSLPHKIGIPMRKFKSKLTKKVWEAAEDLARGKRYIFLADLVESAKNKTGEKAVYINDSIFEIVSQGLLISIPLDVFKEKYTI